MVLRATLKTGEQFVVDFTHDQWGWDECLYDWATFVEVRTSSVIDIAPVGQWSNITCHARNIAPAPKSYDFGIVMLRKEIMKSVLRKTHELLSPYRNWGIFFGLSPDVFSDLCAEISSGVEKAIQEAQSIHAHRGLGRIYFEEPEHFWKQGGDDLWKMASWTHNVVVNPYTARRYKGVWLSEEEFQLQGKLDARKRVWAEKMRKAALKLEVNFYTPGSLGLAFPI